MIIVWLVSYLCIAVLGIIYQANEDYNSDINEHWMSNEKLKPLKYYLDRTFGRCIFAVMAGLVYGIIKQYAPTILGGYVTLILILVLAMISTEVGAIQRRAEALTYLSIATALNVPKILCALFILQLLLVIWIWKDPNEYDRKYRWQCALFLIAALANIACAYGNLSSWTSFYILIGQSCILPLIVGGIAYIIDYFGVEISV